MQPRTPYYLKRKQVKKSVDGQSINYSDVNWSRKNIGSLFGASVLIATSAHFLKLSRYWYFVSFVPAMLVLYMDRKYAPYGELESFYNYLYERRKAEAQFKLAEKEIDGELAKLDKENYSKIKSELIQTNKTLYEVGQELDELYLQAAIKSDTHH